MSQSPSQPNPDQVFGFGEPDLSVSLMQNLIAKTFYPKEVDKKAYILNLASEIPVRIFSGNRLWDLLKEEGTTIEHLVPTLIVSLERLLEEIEILNLTKKKEVCDNFNPINFLAHHLHSNNPRYLNVHELSTYILKLRYITKELCKQYYISDEHRLTKLKRRVQMNREYEEKKNKERQQEMIQRFQILKDQFSNWLLPLQNKLELKSVKNSLQTFVEFSEDIPPKIFQSSEVDLSFSKLGDEEKMLNCNEFAELVLGYTINMTGPVFELFKAHLNKCAGAYQYLLNSELRRTVLTNLFMTCDKLQLGVVDRHRVLDLLKKFWENTTDERRAVLSNPKRWPVVEVEESELPLDDLKPPTTKEKPKPIPIPTTKEENEKDMEIAETLIVPELPLEENSSIDEGSENISQDVTPTPKKATPRSKVVTSDPPPKELTFSEKNNLDQMEIDRESTGVSLGSVSAFDKDILNVHQFVQLMETFLGTQHLKSLFDELIDYLHVHYMESEDEKKQRQEKANQEMLSAKRQKLSDDLFDKWDNDAAGYLELNQIEPIMYSFKSGAAVNAVKRAKAHLKHRIHEDRLSKKDFHNFLNDVIKCGHGQVEYDFFIDYLNHNIELSKMERTRGKHRKNWLNSIINAGRTNGTKLSQVFNSVFSCIYKDAEMHGGGKKVSAYIALLVDNRKNPKERGENFLHYMAATPDHAEFVKGKILYRDMKGVSFLCVDKGVPVYVPKVKTHGNIHFWNQARWKMDHGGSFLVIPIKDNQKRVFGVLGIDTINDDFDQTVFVTHETNFYQGISKAFSIAYHEVEIRKRMVKILGCANRWIHRHCVDICEISVYLVEFNAKLNDIVLKKVSLTTPQNGTVTYEDPAVLERKESLFKDYLFRCVDNSESITADAYGQHHFAYPLRDKEGKVSFVVDLSMGPTLKELPNYENRELLRMLRLLQVAYEEISNELAEGDDHNIIIAAEKLNEDIRVEVMFDRLLLMDLRENVSKLDIKAYAEIRSYLTPPVVIRNVIETVLSIFYPEESERGIFQDWTTAKNYVNQHLCQKISQYDPTEVEVLVDMEKIEEKIKNIPHGEVAKHGSVPTENLYNWLFVCISLIEHLKNTTTTDVS